MSKGSKFDAQERSLASNSRSGSSGSVIPVVDVELCARRGHDPLALAQSLADAGARALWWRDKRADPDASLARAAASFGARLWTHPSLLTDADAWHADGATLARWADAGALPRARPAWVSASAHGRRDVLAARQLGLNAVTLSPIWPSTSKPGYGPALGLEALREAAQLMPVFALGGVTPARAALALEAGAAGVAVMGGLCVAEPARAWARFGGAETDEGSPHSRPERLR